jgi:multidrug resistance efflux pump
MAFFIKTMASIKILSKPEVGPSIPMCMILSKFSIFILFLFFCLILFSTRKSPLTSSSTNTQNSSNISSGKRGKVGSVAATNGAAVARGELRQSALMRCRAETYARNGARSQVLNNDEEEQSSERAAARSWASNWAEEGARVEAVRPKS